MKKTEESIKKDEQGESELSKRVRTLFLQPLVVFVLLLMSLTFFYLQIKNPGVFTAMLSWLVTFALGVGYGMRVLDSAKGG